MFSKGIQFGCRPHPQCSLKIVPLFFIKTIDNIFVFIVAKNMLDDKPQLVISALLDVSFRILFAGSFQALPVSCMFVL